MLIEKKHFIKKCQCGRLSRNSDPDLTRGPLSSVLPYIKNEKDVEILLIWCLILNFPNYVSILTMPLVHFVVIFRLEISITFL